MGSLPVVITDTVITDCSQPLLKECEDTKLTILIETFSTLFLTSENTILVSGEDEPIYLPANSLHSHHRIIFANDFFSSALHEISHWLVAGEQRRSLEDYGYWYKPDGRSDGEQAEFERVEIKPQALEWLLSVACDHEFYFSADNLNGNSAISIEFKDAVYWQVMSYLDKDNESRRSLLLHRLIDVFDQPYPVKNSFNRSF